MLGTAFFLVIISYTTTYTGALVCMALAVACCGFHNSGILVNPQDIAPKHAGSVFGKLLKPVLSIILDGCCFAHVCPSVVKHVRLKTGKCWHLQSSNLTWRLVMTHRQPYWLWGHQVKGVKNGQCWPTDSMNAKPICKHMHHI